MNKTKKTMIVAMLIASLGITNNAQAVNPTVATVAGMVATIAIAGVVGVGAGLGYGTMNATNASARISRAQKQALAEVVPDAAQFIASNGHDRTALLNSLIEETRNELESQGQAQITDREIAALVLAIDAAN